MDNYMGVRKRARAEIEAKRSRFIGQVSPVASAEEAESFIDQVRTEHKDARHNSWAYTVGLGTSEDRLSDDGEPRGTAGYPILETLKKRDLRNVACVVTRYFGGKLLGAGGLLRAYGQAASAALDAAGTKTYVYHDRLQVTLEYDRYDRVQRELLERGAYLDQVEFLDKVHLSMWVKPQDMEFATGKIRDLTSGSAHATIDQGKHLPEER